MTQEKETKEIKYPATCVVHWLTGPKNCCDKHGLSLKNIGNLLSIHVAVTAIKEESECMNCINENKNDNN